MAFTSAWQSSKVPSMATAWTLASVAVVIIRRWTSETRPVREEHDGVDPLRAAEGLDGCAAGVAGGGAHHGDALAAGGEHPVHQPRHQLHGHVLEGEGGAVEKLENPKVSVDLDERGHGRVAEAGIGVAGERQQLGARDGAAGEGLQDRGGDLGEGLAGEGGDGLRAAAAARSRARRGRRRGRGPRAGPPRSPRGVPRLWC